LHHLTFTLPESADGPAKQIKQLLTAFASLRRRSVWQSIGGGVRKVEATCSVGLWHCHLHVFAKADSIDLESIQAVWLKLTGASIIDCKPIDSDEYRINVAYYVAKPPQSQFLKSDDRDALYEWLRQTKGMRPMATFGDWRGTPLLPRHPSGTPPAPYL
jgi:hypothetical protein